jgi:hypothetical protein
VALPLPWQDRIRLVRIRIQRRFGLRTTRPVVIPGEGPVVLLNAIGSTWEATVAAVDRRTLRAERLVVVTDQPVMHLARALPIVVEYVPAGSLCEPAQVASRLAEIVRVYAVERVDAISGLPADSSDTVA